ncbi:MAG TPA: hypothetical protein VMU61_09880 [Candidatus Aquilonibacter sp.]|nr:hypothetical protein [Candidatus Aquilonibacter sp.]
MKFALTMSTVLVLAAGMLAQNAGSTAKPQKAKPITAADVQALKDAIAAQQQTLLQQQQELQQLQQQLQQRDQSVQQAQTAATDAASKADAASEQASHSQVQVDALKTDVNDLKTGMANTAQTLQETQKTISESPLALHFRGVTITPGGFAAAEFVRRSRALAADINTPFNSVTMPGASQSTTSEFFGSGRQSRLSMLVNGRLKSALLSGYLEADFLSAAVTSNNNESNSYALRQRQVWGQAAFDNGWSFTGGQMWSLVTETRHGLDNRTEATPLTIDAQYSVGFSWARQYGLRLVKNFDNKVWFGLSMENAQATVTTHNNAANFLIGSAGNSGGLYNSAISTCSSSLNSTGTSVTTTCSPIASYSFNPSPDLIAKLAFEPGFGHYEVFGVLSHFRDRVFPCAEASATFPCANGATAPTAALAYNPTANGGGMGANARWSFADKHFDFGLHGFGGSGVGRYGTGGLPDASINGNGTFHLVKSLQGLATVEIHALHSDIYFNTGAEYASRAASYDPISGKVVGYGAPTFSNSGCYSETLPSNGTGFLPGGLSSCTADTRVLIEGTAGFWYRIYDGSKEKVNRGRIQFGPQYSYVDRETWSGGGLQPHGIDSMIFTSFRYYLP